MAVTNLISAMSGPLGQTVGQPLGQTVATGFAAMRERTLPLLPVFADLVPGAALQRGSIVGCDGVAAMSLAMAVAAGPVQQGAWVAVAGAPTFGAAAAAELGVALERLVMVRDPPGGFDDGRWADVVAAMIDGFDVIVLGSGARRIRPGIARRLQAKVQSRGAVLVLAARLEAFTCDLRVHAEHQRWEGLGAGHGVAASRRLTVELDGRRIPRPRRTEMLLPAPGGGIELAGAVADIVDAGPEAGRGIGPVAGPAAGPAMGPAAGRGIDPAAGPVAGPAAATDARTVALRRTG